MNEFGTNNTAIQISERVWIGPEVYNNLITIEIENHMNGSFVVVFRYMAPNGPASFKPIVGSDFAGLEIKIKFILAEIDRIRGVNQLLIKKD